AGDRADLLLRTAEILRSRKLEFSAWLTFETGKNWAEADADTGEAIDFLEFYAREALRLGAVISPWNFPLAIMAGMTSASIVAGNTVVLKPSSDAPTIAAMFVEALQEAGM